MSAQAVKERHAFKAGDEVPPWIERPVNCKAWFNVDVEADLLSNTAVEVHPVAHPRPGESIMRIEAIDPTRPCMLCGAPTTLFSHPRGAPQNVPALMPA